MSNAPAETRLAPVVEDEDVLTAARKFSDQISDAELGLMAMALEWAHRNPGGFMSKHRRLWGSAGMGDLGAWETPAAQGCVLVDEMSIPEFAYASGMSEHVAQSWVNDAVVMFYRFPRTWARMNAGHVPVWRARLVPRYGRDVPVKVAAYVDRHLDRPGARFTRPEVQRLIDEARLRFTPDEVAAEVAAEAEERRVNIDTQSAAHLGLADFDGCLELPDAIDLEAALAYGASKLKEAGSTDPLHVRRAHALGDLARAAQAPSQNPSPDRAQWDGTGVPRTGAKIYIHLNHTALKCVCDGKPADETPESGSGTGSVLEYLVTGPGPPPGPGVTPKSFLLPKIEREGDRLGEAARVDGTGMPTVVVDPSLIRRWFTRPSLAGPRAGPKITVRQVVDPEEYVSSEAYEIPERVKEAITTSHSRTCIFPYCQATSVRSDCDHTTPFDDGGPTCSCNVGVLCRRHHRLKTHGQHHDDHRWTYAHLGDDSYVWSGPNGIHLLRTPLGTHVLPGDIFTTRPADGTPTPGVRKPDGTFTAFDENHDAFETVTDPLALPNTDANGHPIPAPRKALVQQMLDHRAQDLDAFTYYERYAARGAHLARPKIEFAELPKQLTLEELKQRGYPSVQALRDVIEQRVAENKEILRTTTNDDSWEDPEEPSPFDKDGPPPF